MKRKTKPQSERVQLNIDLPEEFQALGRDLKMIAAHKGVSLKDLCLEAMQEYVKTHKSKVVGEWASTLDAKK